MLLSAIHGALHRMIKPKTSENSKFSHVDALLVGMSLIWGLNFVVIKASLDFFPPLSFNALRFSIASALLILILKLKEKTFKVHRSDLKRFILLALLGNTIYQLLFINGILRTTAGNSSLILATAPIFISVFSSALGVEKVGRRVWEAMVISFSGTLLIVLGSGKPLSLSAQNVWGDILILACTMCWSAYTVLSKPLLEHYSPLRLVGLTVAIGTPPLILTSAHSLTIQDWTGIPIEAWLGLAYSSCLAIAIGYTIWYTGVSQVGGARTALYENLVTVIAVTAAWTFLHETLSPLQLVGAALIFVGLHHSRSHA
ncbi:MAG: DMT family transporter [Candidatus Bathyarchaeia archaeon]